MTLPSSKLRDRLRLVVLATSVVKDTLMQAVNEPFCRRAGERPSWRPIVSAKHSEFRRPRSLLLFTKLPVRSDFKSLMFHCYMRFTLLFNYGLCLLLFGCCSCLQWFELSKISDDADIQINHHTESAVEILACILLLDIERLIHLRISTLLLINEFLYVESVLT